MQEHSTFIHALCIHMCIRILLFITVVYTVYSYRPRSFSVMIGSS